MRFYRKVVVTIKWIKWFIMSYHFFEAVLWTSSTFNRLFTCLFIYLRTNNIYIYIYLVFVIKLSIYVFVYLYICNICEANLQRHLSQGSAHKCTFMPGVVLLALRHRQVTQPSTSPKPASFWAENIHIPNFSMVFHHPAWTNRSAKWFHASGPFHFKIIW